MKIVFVIGLYPYQIGGAEMQAKEIANVFSSLGHKIHYLCYSPKIYSSDEFDVSIIKTRKKYDIFYYGTRTLLFEALDKIRPDIVYHRAIVPYSRFLGVWCKKNSIPFYLHCADIYTLTRKNYTLYNVISNIWLRETLRLATGIICQNKEQFDALSRHNIKNIRIIYNIHQKNFRKVTHGNSKNIVWIAKFEQAKQPEVFIELAERLKDKNYTFTMFSSKFSNNEFNNRLIEKIKQNPQITLYQGKDNTVINDYLCNNASLLVNTSISEGISNTFIQAWMRGVPVISLNSNPDGWFDQYQIGGCCNGSLDKAVDLINKILDESKYFVYSQNSIEFANNNFSPEIITPQLLEFMNLK